MCEKLNLVQNKTLNNEMKQQSKEPRSRAERRMETRHDRSNRTRPCTMFIEYLLPCVIHSWNRHSPLVKPVQVFIRFWMYWLFRKVYGCSSEYHCLAMFIGVWWKLVALICKLVIGHMKKRWTNWAKKQLNNNKPISVPWGVKWDDYFRMGVTGVMLQMSGRRLAFLRKRINTVEVSSL